jgi:hypothetical protein
MDKVVYLEFNLFLSIVIPLISGTAISLYFVLNRIGTLERSDTQQQETINHLKSESIQNKELIREIEKGRNSDAIHFTETLGKFNNLLVKFETTLKHFEDTLKDIKSNLRA